jgi:hypothetical protein
MLGRPWLVVVTRSILQRAGPVASKRTDCGAAYEVTRFRAFGCGNMFAVALPPQQAISMQAGPLSVTKVMPEIGDGQTEKHTLQRNGDWQSH